MSRPPLEVADLIRTAGAAFIERNRQWIRWKHVKVLLAIARCRTATLGGHVDQCTRCGHRATISYNSCRNRHCPKCQTAARERWIAARQKELLPTRYVHVVFTLPSQLARLALQNKKFIYGLLLQASAETLLEVARDQRHLGAEIGFFSVLHTWNQRLSLHPHVHCVIPAGGLSLDHTHWVTSPNRFFLPLKVLSRVFRGKFVAALKQAFQNGRLSLHGNLALLAQPKTFVAWLRPLFRKDWVVYAKPPFGGPQYVLQYLGRYTHRVAISNHRLVSFTDGKVTFRWRDSAHNNEQKFMTLPLDEFLRRFLLHVLPKGFVRIRNFGFLANRRRATLLPFCFQLLGAAQEPQAKQDVSSTNDSHDLWRCPKCGGPMVVVEKLTAAEIQLRSPPLLTAA
ncbi:MAG: IS91 family transposase [Acidobacteria bacterium]|nr:MAG: IS91 family transposase [Acidobacteriota bacterium]